MVEDSLPSPHDRFFKETFGRVGEARSCFDACLPRDITQHFTWAALKLEPGEFIDEAMREHSADLLYSVPFRGEPMYLYLLFEHQSTPDHWMPLRCHGYMHRIWAAYRKANPKARKLPPILPVVLYQGGRGWKVQRQFAGLLEYPADAAEALGPFIPDFQYVLIDLSEISPEELRGTVLMRVALALLKAARDRTLIETFERVQPLIREMMLAEGAGRMIAVLLKYIYTVDSTATPEVMTAILAKEPQPDIDSAHMSIADQLISRGMEKGIEKGREEGVEKGRRIALRENILEILEDRFGALPYEINEKLAAIEDEDRLRQLFRAGLKAGSVEEFSAAL